MAGANMKILITGAAGRLGRRLASHLKAEHELILGDIAPRTDGPFIPLDVTDLEAAREATRGCEAVIHMAILDWPPCSREEELGFMSAALQVHTVGTSNVLQAAWEAGVKQFIHISSVSAVDGLPPDVRVDSSTRHYSNSVYGLTKGFGEDLCRMYHHAVGLSVAILRLGTIYNPEPDGVWIGNIFHPHTAGPPPLASGTSGVHVEDVMEVISLALHPPQPGYVLVHVVGADSGDLWDLEAAGQVYGWQPRYTCGADGMPHLAGFGDQGLPKQQGPRG